MILNVVCLIPAGQVATYGQMASQAGLPKHARLGDYVLKPLSTKHTVLWHRVINAQGKISLSKLNAQGKNIQTLTLQAEGIVSIAEKVNFKQYQWHN